MGTRRPSARHSRAAAPRVRGACRFSVIHLAVFSVGTPTASARTSAAAAEGASPTTEPGPWVASHAARTAAMVVDFPVPAAPTSTSSRRPEVTTAATAVACSAESTWALPGTAMRAELGGDGGVHNRPVDGLPGGQEPGFGVEELLGGVDLAVARAQHARPVRALQVLRSTRDRLRGEHDRPLRRQRGDVLSHGDSILWAR